MEELTNRQRQLLSDIKRLSKVANQRILEIERLTKRKSPHFAVKDLADYLSSVEGLTKRKGKSIRVTSGKKSLTETQMIGIKKATENFIKNTEGSTIKGIKKFTKNMEEKTGNKINIRQSATLYEAMREYKWIEDYTNGSEFWNYYDYSFKKSVPSEDEFINYLKTHLFDEDTPIDETLKQKLINLRAYLIKDL